MPDSLSDQYADLLTGSYDCVDRIVLNGYFRMGHDPGGFRLWWRALMGSDETLDNTHLMHLAGHPRSLIAKKEWTSLVAKRNELDRSRYSTWRRNGETERLFWGRE